MPAQPPRRRCPRTGCGNPSPCPDHQRHTDSPHLNRPNADFYASKQWHQLRAHILDTQRICPGWPTGTPCGQRTQHADHIHAIQDGGPKLDPTNIQGLCASCHSHKTAAEVAARRRRTPTHG